MRTSLYKFIVTAIILCACNPVNTDSIKSFYITVTDTEIEDGQITEYLVTKDSLKIFSDCLSDGCQEKLIYKQKLDYKAADKFADSFAELGLDSLKRNYEIEGHHGLSRRIVFQKNSDRLKYISLERSNHPSVDSLVKKIRRLVTDEKYKDLE